MIIKKIFFFMLQTLLVLVCHAHDEQGENLLRIYRTPHESLVPFGVHYVPHWVSSARNVDGRIDRYRQGDFIFAPHDLELHPVENGRRTITKHHEQHNSDYRIALRDIILESSFLKNNIKLMDAFNLRISVAHTYQGHIRPNYSTMVDFQNALLASLSSQRLKKMPISTEIKVFKSCNRLYQSCDMDGPSYNSFSNLFFLEPTPTHRSKIMDFDLMHVNPEADLIDLNAKLKLLSEDQSIIKDDLYFLRSKGILLSSFERGGVEPFWEAEYFSDDQESLDCHFSNIKLAINSLASYLKNKSHSIEVDYEAMNNFDHGYSFLLGLGLTDRKKPEYFSIDNFYVDSLALLPCTSDSIDTNEVKKIFLEQVLEHLPLTIKKY